MQPEGSLKRLTVRAVNERLDSSAWIERKEPRVPVEDGLEGELELFCKLQYPDLVGLLSLYCGDRWAAEELAQEALYRASRDWKRVRLMDLPQAWLRRVAINLARSRIRRASVEKRAQTRFFALKSNTYNETDAASAVAVREAISALPHRQKAVLVLHYYGDLSFAQVADVLECPEGTVKSLAHRAISRLRSRSGLLDEQGGIACQMISEV